MACPCDNQSISYIIYDIQETTLEQEESVHEEEEEFNDAVVSVGQERTHISQYSKFNHIYMAGGRKYDALEAMEDR